ncbi:hypothetical protein BDB00DRAFT_814070 [Zychaea mexicana]|uniref:uncharacterized protein n=1 Tax=Zychaea mexicana TaxID=64656 RepID=UPI0022FDBAE2|nr:uncharacterized protein BDB00DRAFT_814070 [Zychaea mexicana]KAI9495304.1 hypothetical protein BDB00DRAFT_814070 [Zychaea mexicana]
MLGFVQIRKELFLLSRCMAFTFLPSSTRTLSISPAPLAKGHDRGISFVSTKQGLTCGSIGGTLNCFKCHITVPPLLSSPPPGPTPRPDNTL